jgi:hypothetical protein
MMFKRIIPFLFLVVFLAPLTGKSFHHHHHDQCFHQANERGLIIEENCPVCNYEFSDSDLQARQYPDFVFILNDSYLISECQDPQAPGISVPFFLRAPPCD